MTFASLQPAQIDAFLRHASLDDIFELARDLDMPTASRLKASPVQREPPGPSQAALNAILSSSASRRGKGAEALARNQESARAWVRRFHEARGPLPIAKPEGKASGIRERSRELFAPLKEWLALAGGVLASELSLRSGRGAWTAASRPMPTR